MEARCRGERTRGSSSGRLSFALGACGAKVRLWCAACADAEARSYGIGMERGRRGGTTGAKSQGGTATNRPRHGGRNQQRYGNEPMLNNSDAAAAARRCESVCRAATGKGPGRRTYPGSLLHFVLEIIEPIEELVELLPLGRHGEASVWRWANQANAKESRLCQI